ncbi:hypothetical protein [Marinicella rhabdoformis]|uniref:hypothetical protein n=1 Tax=Marinicella rhabdoformis TaxID=2580566 RepID=UPI0012AEDB69|nr:hypothetical protein [Marinicella rhabdoformis]
MSNTDSNNNDSSNNDTINDLYQDSIKGQGNEQPPAALDQLIQQAAKDSLNAHSVVTKKGNRSMWMAAASVALVAPLLYWLTLNLSPTEVQQAEDYFRQADMESVAQPKPAAQAPPKADKKMAAKEEVLADEYDLDEQIIQEQGKITVTGSRIMRNPKAENDGADDEAKYEPVLAEESQSVEAESPAKLSLQRNKALLKSEFKAKKQRISKDSIADPMMALEWQQLQQYIAQGEKAQAQALLATMQVDWPDYDFNELIEAIENIE